MATAGNISVGVRFTAHDGISVVARRMSTSVDALRAPFQNVERSTSGLGRALGSLPALGGGLTQLSSRASALGQTLSSISGPDSATTVQLENHLDGATSRASALSRALVSINGPNDEAVSEFAGRVALATSNTTTLGRALAALPSPTSPQSAADLLSVALGKSARETDELGGALSRLPTSTLQKPNDDARTLPPPLVEAARAADELGAALRLPSLAPSIAEAQELRQELRQGQKAGIWLHSTLMRRIPLNRQVDPLQARHTARLRQFRAERAGPSVEVAPQRMWSPIESMPRRPLGWRDPVDVQHESRQREQRAARATRQQPSVILDPSLGMTVTRLGRSLETIKHRATDTRAAFGAASSSLKTWAMQAGVAVGTGALLMRSQLRLMATIADQRAALVGLTGSTALADGAQKQIFRSAQTLALPVEQLTDSWIRLRAQGLEPTESLLTGMRAAAVGTGRTFDDLARAVEDAGKGNWAKFDGFGFQVDETSARVRLRWVDDVGKKQVAILDKHNKQQISGELAAILNARYGAAWKARENQTEDALARVGNHWYRFRARVAEVMGPALTRVLTQFTERVEQWASSGQLDAWADKVGDTISRGLGWLETNGPAIVSSIGTIATGIGWLTEAVGGAGNMLLLLGGLWVAKPIIMMARFGMSLWRLTGAVAATGKSFLGLGGIIGRLSGVAGKAFSSIGTVVVRAFSGLGGLAVRAITTMAPLMGKALMSLGSALLPLIAQLGAVLAAGFAGWKLGTLIDEQITKALGGKSLGESVFDWWKGNDEQKKIDEAGEAQRLKTLALLRSTSAPPIETTAPAVAPIWTPNTPPTPPEQNEMSGKIVVELAGPGAERAKVKQVRSRGLELDVDAGLALGVTG